MKSKTEPKHTPGPWETVKSSINGSSKCWTKIRISSESAVIAEVDFEHKRRDGYGTPAQNEANARLISASPTMFDAIKSVLDDDTSGLSHKSWDALTEAIAKAIVEGA